MILIANKLKNLKITSVDLCKEGANQESYICLFKHKEEEVDLKIDKSKMSPNEQALFDTLVKKYGLETDEAGSSGDADKDVKKGASAAKDKDVKKADKPNADTPPADKAAPGLHPEVKKALEDLEQVRKTQAAQIEELQKSLETERLTTVAKKYEIIGKKPAELAVKLYEMKKAGGTVYDDYVALLDEHVTTVEKSGVFGEIGSNNAGISGAVSDKLSATAAEIKKAATGAGITDVEALIKAFEENPELAAEYEAEYSRR